MNAIGKFFIAAMILNIIVAFIMFRSDDVVIQTKKQSYEDAIRAAANVATKELIDLQDINIIYDGDKREPMDITIDFDSLDRFRVEMERICATQADGTLKGVSRINMPLAGFVSYRYILGVTFDDKYLPPMAYTYYMNSPVIDEAFRDKIWEFTLGDKVIIENNEYFCKGTTLITRDESEVYDFTIFLSTFGFPDMKSFAQYVVMSRIDEYLNTYSSASFNKIADDVQAGVAFNLGKTNYSAGRQDYSQKSSVIEGPGVFAVVDVYTGSGDTDKLYERLVSFGGSELTVREDKPKTVEEIPSES